MARQTSLHHRSNQTRNRQSWRCLAERKLRLRIRQYGERYLWFESISLRHDLSILYYIRIFLPTARIPASFPRLVADAFFAHPVETISRPFSAAFGPRVSKSTFGGTGVSDCSVPGNHLSVLTSPSEAANNGVSVGEQGCALRRCIVWRGAQSLGAVDAIVRDGPSGYANPSAAL